MYAWLDKHIKEQAACYGLTPDQHARLIGGAATYQEKIDMHQVNEPKREPYVTPPEYLAAKPKRVDQERFDYMLNVLPPCKWQRGRYMETFHVSEYLSGNIVMWMVRIGVGEEATFWEVNQPDNLTQPMLHKLIEEALGKEKAS